MNTIYTPGPWHACCADTHAHYIFAEDTETAICMPLHNDPSLEEYEPMSGIVTMEQRLANARLIAAAPDLLGALLAIISIIERDDKNEISLAKSIAVVAIKNALS